MSEMIMTLFADDERQGRVVIVADDQHQILDLNLTEDTLLRIRNIEDSFAMAEQNLGNLRAG